MKIVHISDIHIHDRPILGSEPVANFRACLAHVERNHSDAAAVVITGDLTHEGGTESYRLLKSILEASALKPRLLIGNHDDRAAFLEVFADHPVDSAGYIQWAEDVGPARFLYLDTAGPSHAGHYEADRRAWLEAQLKRARADGRSVYIFMHHNPSPVGVRSADIIGMVEGKAFRAILGENRDIIRHVFFGHCHFVLAGSVAGVPMSAPRSTNHPCVPEFESRKAMGYGGLPPTYDVCLIEDDYVAVHSVDFLAGDNHAWEPISDEGWIDETGEAAA